jgi:hypothetical protein
MSTLMKSLLALAVALPLGAYVTGTLVASGDEPPPREPVIIQENTLTPTDQPTRRTEPADRPTRSQDDDDDDEIDVITPRPGNVGDDDDDRGGGDDKDDDDRGDDGDDDD